VIDLKNYLKANRKLYPHELFPTLEPRWKNNSKFKIALSYMIDLYYAFTISTIIFTLYFAWLNDFVLSQVMWNSLTLYTDKCLPFQLVTTPIIFFTLQFLSISFNGHTLGMQALSLRFSKSEWINNQNQPINPSMKQAFEFALLNTVSLWSFGLVLFLPVKKQAHQPWLMVQATGLNWIDLKEYYLLFVAPKASSLVEHDFYSQNDNVLPFNRLENNNLVKKAA
jgi:hypothetical protein